jgi:hypothetical protein
MYALELLYSVRFTLDIDLGQTELLELAVER